MSRTAEPLRITLRSGEPKSYIGRDMSFDGGLVGETCSSRYEDKSDNARINAFERCNFRWYHGSLCSRPVLRTGAFLLSCALKEALYGKK